MLEKFFILTDRTLAEREKKFNDIQVNMIPSRVSFPPLCMLSLNSTIKLRTEKWKF